MNAYSHGIIRAAVESFELPEPILEVGARVITGQEHTAIRPLFGGREYVGVDIEPGPNVDRVADVQSLPFDQGSFGTILALNVFEHTPRFWLGIEELFRVLKPHGVMILAVPFYFHIHNYPGDYWRVSPQAMNLILGRCPKRIIGTQGSRTRPMHVFGIGFSRLAPFDAHQWDAFQTRKSKYAIEPIDWRTRWVFPLARVVCGRRPFEPWIDLNRGEWELKRDAVSS
jgi:SAM-dependent methyltransferase